MPNLTKILQLIQYCEEKNCSLEITRNPLRDNNELWEIRLYPDPADDGHFFALYDNLERAAYKLLHEMELA